jgi:hypothetical protein
MTNPAAFDLGRSVGIVPAMPGRGYRTPAAGIAAAVAVLAAALAGCDSHSKPTAVPPLSSAPTSPGGSSLAPQSRSASPSPALSSPIVGASAMDSAFPSAAAQIPAAIETVRKFFDGVNHEGDTGDEGPAIATFTTKCTLCGSEVFSIKSLLDNGRVLRGGHSHILSVDEAYASYANVVSVIVTSTQDAGDQLDANGNVIQHFTAAPPTKFDFELETDKSPPVIWQLSRFNP